MANNKVTMNGYSFEIVGGRLVPNIKANLKNIEDLTNTTKSVAMEVAKEVTRTNSGELSF